MPEGRIIKGVGGRYSVYVYEEEKIYTCQACGRFRAIGVKPLVGDTAEISITNQDEGYILELAERKNEIIRPRCANIDIIAAVFPAAKPEGSLAMLDTFLIFASKQTPNAEIVICITKCELNPVAELMRKIYAPAGYAVFETSAVNKSFDGLETALAGKTSVFAGQSGTGKSSLINALCGLSLETNTLSRKIERGRHTTRHTELFPAPFAEKTFIADAPGFSSFSYNDIKKQDLAYFFPETRPFLNSCVYTDCAHITEDGCAVKENVGTVIHETRYERYKQFYYEIAKGKQIR
ncbi:MAG: ribosome small subunit-dependent GTPase A [Clostridiales bacterium]|jgi:ribosome biogenesis GTPase|nr:ribosome small subunit-dependent GTPase A [Clostridiales bacterium]